MPLTILYRYTTIELYFLKNFNKNRINYIFLKVKLILIYTKNTIPLQKFKKVFQEKM